MQQQQQQAEQLLALQQQLSLVQQQMAGGAPLTTPGLAPTEPATQPETGDTAVMIPAYVNTEISDLADSASTYLSAFSSLAAGRYALAEAGFNQFLYAYPHHQYSANARYWLASAQAAQNKLPAAMTNLQQITSDINGQDKAPAALALLAQLYRKQENYTEADDALEQLRSNYPDSPEAQHFYQGDELQ